MKQIIFFSIMFLTVTLFGNNFQKVGQSVIDKVDKLQWADVSNKDDIWKMSRGYCRQLHIGGYNDWRLPTEEELVTLAKNENLKAVFTHLDATLYWSKDEDKADDLNALIVFSGNGFLSTADKCDKNRALCVRDYTK